MFNFNHSCPRGAQSDPNLNSNVSPALSSIMARLMVLMLLVFIAPQVVRTQVLYGSLTGNVTDQKGATVPGARVEARNVGTGQIKEKMTDQNGAYQFSDLQPGIYNVTYSLASFKTLIRRMSR